MIVIDTNVLSELMLDRPYLAVAEWLDRQNHQSIWTTSVTVFEIRFGLNAMPTGKRRSQRVELFEQLLEDVIDERIAPFDTAAGEQAAQLAADRRRMGTTGELRDTMIAGIVLANHATLATRNVKHFEDMAKWVVNPWEQSAE